MHQILDQQVRIEYQGSVDDAEFGRQPGAWAILDTVWGYVDEMLPKHGLEQGERMRVTARMVRVRMRYREDVDQTMRVVLVDRNNRILRVIGGPSEIGRRQFIDVLCEEFSSQGSSA